MPAGDQRAFSRDEAGKKLVRAFRYVDEGDARALVRAYIVAYSQRSYQDLVKLVGKRLTERIESPKGLTYDLQTEAFWSGAPEAGELFVALTINDADWVACVDLNDQFIMEPDGTIIGNSGF